MYIDQALKNNIGESLRKDEDVIIASGLRVMKEFGEEILNSKENYLKLLEAANIKIFTIGNLYLKTLDLILIFSRTFKNTRMS